MAREIGVVGAGGWGTALAKVLADKGERVTLWCHGTANFRELAEKRQNLTYLPGILLPERLAVTQTLKDALADKALVICAVPSHAVREVFTDAAAYFDGQTLLLCGTKGLEEATLHTMAELFADIFGATSKGRHGFLSGPTFAIEVARGLPAAVTVASTSESVARRSKRFSAPPVCGFIPRSMWSACKSAAW